MKRTLKQGTAGPDVAAMQLLLNRLPETLLTRLMEDGVFGRKTTARVIEFQKNAKLVVDGVVGPQSWAMLDELTKYLLPPGTTPGTLGSWRDEPFREAVLRVALTEALPVSNVTDFVSVPKDPIESGDVTPLGKPPTAAPNVWRFGWRRLKQYYDEAAEGVTPLWWRQTGEISLAKQTQVITNLNGVRGHTWRVPQPNAPSGVQWCGIFATWCWIKGGVHTKWPWGGPPRGVSKRWMYDKPPAPKPGDILVQGGTLSHHCILLPDSAGADEFLVLNGNSDYQSITIKPIKRASVVAIYSLEDFSGNSDIWKPPAKKK